eukprot:scaffold304077_cov40-Prasinocladus_malaysianus.AAC.1
MPVGAMSSWLLECYVCQKNRGDMQICERAARARCRASTGVGLCRPVTTYNPLSSCNLAQNVDVSFQSQTNLNFARRKAQHLKGKNRFDSR